MDAKTNYIRETDEPMKNSEKKERSLINRICMKSNSGFRDDVMMGIQ
jgi:hypothetical protein